jgi:hypothetical protein
MDESLKNSPQQRYSINFPEASLADATCSTGVCFPLILAAGDRFGEADLSDGEDTVPGHGRDTVRFTST